MIVHDVLTGHHVRDIDLTLRPFLGSMHKWDRYPHSIDEDPAA